MYGISHGLDGRIHFCIFFHRGGRVELKMLIEMVVIRKRSIHII